MINRIVAAVTLAFMLTACGPISVKPPTVVEVSCTSMAGLWYEAGVKYKAGKYSAEEIVALRADAAVLDPKCTAAVEPTTDELMKDPAVVAAAADLTKKATK